MRAATLTAIATATTLLPLQTWAMAQPRVGVFPLEVQGQLPPNGAEAFTSKIDQSLSSMGVTVVPPDELAHAASAGLESCTDEQCLQALSTAATAPRLVRPSVMVEHGDYVIALEVIDGANGRVVHQASQTCELCGLSEALEITAQLTASLEAQLTPPAEAVAIESTPTPEQVPIDEDPPAKRSNELPPAIGWAALGVGIAAVGAGVTLLVLDQRPVTYTRCSGIDVDMLGNCRYRHDTLAGGVVMTVIGVVGITAGALLIARTRAKRGQGDERRARLGLAPHGVALHF